jgi:hypothetical protein
MRYALHARTLDVALDNWQSQCMSQSAGAVTKVLDLLQVLYDRGADVGAEPGSLLEALEDAGIGGFDDDEEELLLTMGLILRLLLRHAEADPDAMFNATREELAELGSDIEGQSFMEIAARFDEQ